MRIIEIKEKTPHLINQLLKIWESSVRATHFFLSDNEINMIKEYVPNAINNISHLIIALDDSSTPIAFMGIEDKTLEMLFISAQERKKGIGKHLLQYVIENYDVQKLTVNEQNSNAKGFYEHMGFKVYKKSSHDEQGNPYPILYMNLEK